MNHKYRFEKILNLREKEKDSQVIAYEEAREQFEKVAEKLYAFLKQKEEFLEKQEAMLKEGVSISEIKQQQVYLTALERSISNYQTKVIEARQKMFMESEILKQKNIEVKKYESLKEKDYQKFLENLKTQDSILMDEISIQQYMKQIRR